MTSSSSFSDSSAVERNLLHREVTPIIGASSFERIASLFDDGKSSDGTPYPPPNELPHFFVSVTIPAIAPALRKRKNPKSRVVNPEPSSVSKRARRI